MLQINKQLKINDLQKREGPSNNTAKNTTPRVSLANVKKFCLA
jgi:hypothetical protein